MILGCFYLINHVLVEVFFVYVAFLNQSVGSEIYKSWKWAVEQTLEEDQCLLKK